MISKESVKYSTHCRTFSFILAQSAYFCRLIGFLAVANKIVTFVERIRKKSVRKDFLSMKLRQKNLSSYNKQGIWKQESLEKWYIVPRLLEAIRLKRQRKLNEYDFFPLSGMFQQESIFSKKNVGKIGIRVLPISLITNRS